MNGTPISLIADDMKRIAQGKTDKEMWDEIISALRTAGLSESQVLEVMKKVSVWGVVVYMKCGDDLLKGMRRKP